MKTVCIVGAGPAGLASAKVLLQTKQFRVTIFERSNKIGGIWAVNRMHPAQGYLHPDTPTNLSRFTVGFSDLDWNAVGLENVPLFPKAWQVNQYLEKYRAKNIPDECIRFNHTVVKAENTADGWQVTTRAKHEHDEAHDFDYLMLGSGFFSSPRLSRLDLSHSSADGFKSIHSSQLRSLDDLFARDTEITNKNILMIGGGNSAGEAAAAIAQMLSDAWYSPGTGRSQRYKGCKIVHVTPRPIYALPPFNPVDKQNFTFQPLDLKLYELSRRPAGPIIGNAGQLISSVKDIIHNALQEQIGGDQSDLGASALTIPAAEPRSTVYVALSESYPEFVRSGLIDVHAGRVVKVEGSPDGMRDAEVVSALGTFKVENIAAIVYATGYSPAPSIDFLPDVVKEQLHYDSTSARLPLILSGWQTTSPDVSSLALIGFYEGPYWPMIEMQARLTAQRWLDPESEVPIRPYEEPAKLLTLREAMREGSLFVPQYWFGDYLGYIEEMATFLKLRRNDGPFGTREGPTSPARYLTPEDDKEQADAVVADLHRTWLACKQEGRYVARAAFRALQGNWQISRTIESRLPSFPSGVLEGHASFHPRNPTTDKIGIHFDLEYVYQETGSLTLANGASMTTRRSYVYRYSEIRDELSVWFVKPENDLEVDYHFHDLQFAPPIEAQAQGACIAKADHLCVEDMYWTEYRLPFQGISLQHFISTHTVKGPSKDYTMVTKYTRRPRVA